MSDLPEEEPIAGDVEAKRRTLEKLFENNKAIEQDLLSRGFGIQPWVLVNMRIDMLLNAIMDETDRYDFEIQSAKNVHAILMRIQQDTAKQQGKQGGLYVPNKKLLTA